VGSVADVSGLHSHSLEVDSVADVFGLHSHSREVVSVADVSGLHSHSLEVGSVADVSGLHSASVYRAKTSCSSISIRCSTDLYEMGRAYGAHGREEEYIKNFCGKVEGRRPLGRPRRWWVDV
jgi:hypothetical protein